MSLDHISHTQPQNDDAVELVATGATLAEKPTVVTSIPTFASVASTTASAKKRKKRQNGFKTMFISGVGFLADAYDLFVIDFVMAILTATAYNEPTTGEKGLIVSATLAGAVIGQLGFGFLADFIGRRVMFITTAALCILGNIVCACVGFGYQTHATSFSIFHQLAVIRFLLGVGIGGEYPLAATVASEADDDEGVEPEPATGCLYFLEQKPNSIAAVFSMQGVGMLLSPLLVMLLIKTGASLEFTWRFCLGIGALPSAIAFFFRWRMHESASFTKNKRNQSLADSGDASTAMFDSQPTSIASSISSVSFINGASPATTDASPQAASQKTVDEKVPKHVAAVKEPKRIETSESMHSIQAANGAGKKKPGALGKHLKHSWNSMKQFKMVLIGTSMTWFIIDVTFYGTGSFKSEVVGEMFKTGGRRLTEVDYLSEGVRREIEFPSSIRQLQRDSLRGLLSSFAPTIADDDSFNSESVASRVAASLRFLASTEQDSRDKLFTEAVMGTVVACLAIPGYILSVFFIHKTGLRNLTLYGFFAVALAFFVLGGEQFLGLGIRAIELILFGLTFLFTNFGPNSTTFILPTTVYPSVVRATCHGFSAAMGKLGGVVGTNLFGPVNNSLGLAWLQIICGFVAVVGGIVTYFFIPTDKKARESIQRHDDELAEKANRNRKIRAANNPSQVINVH